MAAKASIVGDVINFRGFVYGPVNEMGVVALFARISEDLGFIIEEMIRLGTHKYPIRPVKTRKIEVGSTTQTKLWQMALDRPQIDADELAEAVEEQAQSPELDYRTRLLIRRGLEALQRVWGEADFERWIMHSRHRVRLGEILTERFDEIGFPSLAERVTMTTKPETVEQYLRELGTLVSQPTQLVIGGAIAGILPGYLHRHTEDIDVPDEVPESIRALRQELERLGKRYGLRLTHFPSHYLPDDWQQRLHQLGDFGRLMVSIVDPYDLFVGKLFSQREKDRDDLRVLSRSLDKAKTTERLRSAGRLLADTALKQAAAENWYILYGEPLPETTEGTVS